MVEETVEEVETGSRLKGSKAAVVLGVNRDEETQSAVGVVLCFFLSLVETESQMSLLDRSLTSREERRKRGGRGGNREE